MGVLVMEKSIVIRNDPRVRTKMKSRMMRKIRKGMMMMMYLYLLVSLLECDEGVDNRQALTISLGND